MEAGNIATVILATGTIGGCLAWLLRRFLIDELNKIQHTQNRVLHQVQNSHGTNLRDDIDLVLKEQRALRADLQSHLQWHQLRQQRHDEHHRHKDGL